MESSKFYKNNEHDRVWWLDNPDQTGVIEFSFDKEKIYNLFADYPQKLSVDEWKIFNEENPFWAEFFKDRNESYEDIHFKEINESVTEG